MLLFQNGGRLVQAINELPTLNGAHRLYLDFETTSGDPRKSSLNPWKDCAICGIGVTADDAQAAWYVPIRHHDSRWNLPLSPVLTWLHGLVKSCGAWVNHNVKYDVHAAWRDGIDFSGELVDTVTGAKILDSDRITRGGYELDALSKAWLDEDISRYHAQITPYLGRKNKDYGAVPADRLGEYCCQDVLTGRRLMLHIERRLDAECMPVWAEEVRLTAALVDMEREGMRVDLHELKKKELWLMHQLLKIEEELHRTTDIMIRPHVNDDCFEVLCNKHGLPVLGRTEENNPSFDKETLQSYLRYPLVAGDASLTRTVQLMLQYRKMNTLLTFFVRPYQELQVDGVMHPHYNQAVRTGRLSCRAPNAQQLSSGDDGAKSLVHPAPGCAFLSVDYSQIEFRIIVHYIRDAAAIAAYQANPDTDFHQWVADMCEIPRRPAKNVNFAMAFGGGKKQVLAMLESNMDLVGNLMDRAEVLAKERGGDPIAWFHALARERAEAVYAGYHRTLPGIKRLSWTAANKLRSRGYVRNAYGRRRQLPAKAAFRAFNTVIQSTAADIMKERTNATAPRYNEKLRALGVKQIANVHDEIVFHGREEVIRDPRVQAYIATKLEQTRVAFRVPIRVTMGLSARSWAEACSGAAGLSIDRGQSI